jgi:pimeloyl-ACP methyl ester carboxylesterase
MSIRLPFPPHRPAGRIPRPYWCLAAGIILLAGCSHGFLYRNAPPLDFQDLDYGYPTRVSAGPPAVAYIDQGSGPRTLLLVHGLASNAGFWRENVGPLAEHYRVIAVDLPGFGKSAKDAAFSYSLSFQVEALKRLVTELDLKHVTVVGQSMGGQIAILFALGHPAQAEALVLVSPAGIERFGPGEGDWLRHALTVRGIEATDEEGIRRNLALNFANWSDRFEWMVEERARMAKAPDFDQFAYATVQSVRAMLDEPTTDLLPRLTQPTLLVFGESDGLIPNPYLHPGFPRDVFEAGAEAIPRATLVPIPDAGHLVMIERPEAFNRAVLDFLGSLR